MFFSTFILMVFAVFIVVQSHNRLRTSNSSIPAAPFLNQLAAELNSTADSVEPCPTTGDSALSLEPEPETGPTSTRLPQRQQHDNSTSLHSVKPDCGGRGHGHGGGWGGKVNAITLLNSCVSCSVIRIRIVKYNSYTI